MGIKVFLFPLIALLSLYLIIGYIQPDVVAILEQRETSKIKTDALAKAETVEQNIRSLAQSLDQHQDSEALLKRYFPTAIDQERSVDMVNFLAQQAGVSVVRLLISEEKTKKTVAVAAPAPEDGADASLTAEAPAPEEAKQYRVSVTVLGPYEQVRNFLERLYRTDRMHGLVSFEIRKPTASVGQETQLSDTFLEGELVADFYYTPLRRAGNALSQPVFQNSTFDFQVTNRLADFINSPVGDLEPGTMGRENPFMALP